jgi:hypothetical protein
VQGLMKEFTDYLQSLLSHSGPLWSTLSGIAALFLNIISPTLPFPQPLSWTLIIGGLVWSGFITHKESQAEKKKLGDEVEALKKEPQEPQIKQKLVEGNEYVFELVPNNELEKLRSQLTEATKQEAQLRSMFAERPTPERSQELKINAEALRSQTERLKTDISEYEVRDVIPAAKIELHLRIHNYGEMPVEILQIDSLIISYNTPWIFRALQAYAPNNCKIDFPLTLEKEGILCCNLSGIIDRDSSRSNDILFATRLAPITFDLPQQLIAQVSVRVRWIDRKEKELPADYDIALWPLKELYISQWQKLNRHDLLEKAQLKERYVIWREGKATIDQTH